MHFVHGVGSKGRHDEVIIVEHGTSVHWIGAE